MHPSVHKSLNYMYGTRLGGEFENYSPMYNFSVPLTPEFD